MARTTATNFTGGLQFPYATAPTDIFHKEDVQTLALAVDQHDHTSGKGLVLPVSAIPPITSAMIADGTITSADIADGTIFTTDLTANAITQTALVLGSTNTPTTTSAAAVDLPDMLITLTTVGGDLLVWLYCQQFHSASSGVLSVGLSIDGSGPLAAMQATAPGAGFAQVMSTGILLQGQVAGSHTIRGKWWTPSGGTLTASGTARQMFVAELKR